MPLISSNTHDLQAQVPEEGKTKCMRFMKNVNKQIALTSYLNHSWLSISLNISEYK
jgi:hypothetical protein